MHTSPAGTLPAPGTCYCARSGQQEIIAAPFLRNWQKSDLCSRTVWNSSLHRLQELIASLNIPDRTHAMFMSMWSHDVHWTPWSNLALDEINSYDLWTWNMKSALWVYTIADSTKEKVLNDDICSFTNGGTERLKSFILSAEAHLYFVMLSCMPLQYISNRFRLSHLSVTSRYSKAAWHSCERKSQRL